VKVTISKALASKIEFLKGKGMKLSGSAVKALAAAETRDALMLLGALANRGHVEDPSKFVLVSLEKRQAATRAAASADAVGAKAPGAKAPVAKSPPGATAQVAKSPAGAKPPVAKAPVTKAPITKAPITKAPITKAPIAKAPVTKAPAGAKAPVAKTPAGSPNGKVTSGTAPAAKAPSKLPQGVKVIKAVVKAPAAKAPVTKSPPPKAAGAGQAPRMRTEEELEFFHMAVQAKLMALNQQGLWKGVHPLDEACLTALLKIEAARGLEILDEAEEQGGKLSNPARFVLDLVAEEQTASN